MSKVEPITLSNVETNGGTQVRAEIDQATVKEYAEAAKAGAQLPPIVVYHDGAKYWLADGFHRYWAAARRECKSIRAEVRKGTHRDALLHAVGANAEHGLRRSNEDKRRAVMTLLDDPEWWEWSNKQIAEAAQVDDKTVAKYRDQLRNSEVESGSESQNGDTAKRTGGDGKKRPAKKKAAKKASTAKASGSGNGKASSGGNGSGVSDGSETASEGATATVEQLRTAQKLKNGAELGSTKERREAWKGLQKVVQLLDKLGTLTKYRQTLEAITEEIKPPKG